jgi:hypothetical protein
MRSAAVKAFDLTGEKPALRDKYGRNLFGQGCLLARRLVEQGVPFVEVTLSSAPGVNNGIGWDTHQDNFENVKKLCGALDPAWATLMDDLTDRGLLDTTTVVWMGEFGRTPKINPQKGRDHWANSWSTVLAGGGIKGGQVVGASDALGAYPADRPLRPEMVAATVYQALGIDPYFTELPGPADRPMPLVDREIPLIHELL